MTMLKEKEPNWSLLFWLGVAVLSVSLLFLGGVILLAWLIGQIK